MSKWEFQIRVNLSEKFAEVARKDQDNPVYQLFAELLDRHEATMKNQYDAFADYCENAETTGDTDSVLYRWTKDTIDQPGKKEQYATRFTIYAAGSKEVYDEAIADAIEMDLRPFVDAGLVTKVSKISSDPDKNPQAPKKFF